MVLVSCTLTTFAYISQRHQKQTEMATNCVVDMADLHRFGAYTDWSSISPFPSIRPGDHEYAIMAIDFEPLSNEWKNDRTAHYLAAQIAESMKKVKHYTQRIKPSMQTVPKTYDDEALGETAQNPWWN